MPQGDREFLKADIEDGYTKIANLLLEALAMCKISGVQKSICLFLFRRTYGWNKTKDAISLSDYATACGTSNSYISRQLKDLLEKKIIIRVSYAPGKTPEYTFNTRVTQWDKGCLNVQGLSKCVKQGLYDCARVGLHKCARVNQPQPPEESVLEHPLKKVLKKDKDNNNNNNNNVPYTKIVDLYNSICISLPKVRTISNNRKTHIKARWEQFKQNISSFEELFRLAEESDFLAGRSKSINPKYKSFCADFDWLLNEHNMAKTLEGKYKNKGRASPSDPTNSGGVVVNIRKEDKQYAGKYDNLILR